jgi:transcriptional regulator with XRE-family HTH domain
MGNANSGRRPDLRRRRQIAEWRAQGLSYGQIGRRLGISRQCVGENLRAAVRPPAPAVPCRRCGAVIIPAGAEVRGEGSLLCAACAWRKPGVRFGDVLKAHRLAAGLTQLELARQAGVELRTLYNYEAGRARPGWDTLVKLVRVLGAGLVCPGAVG